MGEVVVRKKRKIRPRRFSRAVVICRPSSGPGAGCQPLPHSATATLKPRNNGFRRLVCSPLLHHLLCLLYSSLMKIYSISVVLSPPGGPSAILSSASDLSSFSFYQRGSVGEFMTFFSKTVVDRTAQGQRQSVQENNYTAHVYNRGGAEQLAGASRTCYS